MRNVFSAPRNLQSFTWRCQLSICAIASGILQEDGQDVRVHPRGRGPRDTNSTAEPRLPDTPRSNRDEGNHAPKYPRQPPAQYVLHAVKQKFSRT